MKYAVIKINGHQYKVNEGEEIEVDRLPQKENEEVAIEETLLLVDGDKVLIGQPYLDQKIRAKILSHMKGKKILVSRFHAKARYRKTKGFRSLVTKIKILPFEEKTEEKKPKPRSRK